MTSFLPNTPGPKQRAMAAAYAARRQRLFAGGAPPVKATVVIRPRPLSPFDPRRVEQEIVAAIEASPPVPLPAWKEILLQVAAKHRLPVSAITGAVRSRAVTPARFECCYRMVMEAGMSYPAAAKRLNRDHTSVMHGVKRHIDTHPELQPLVETKAAEQKSVRVALEDEIIRLYFAEGRSAKAIAEELDVSRPSIHALVHREVVRVRKAMAE